MKPFLYALLAVYAILLFGFSYAVAALVLHMDGDEILLVLGLLLFALAIYLGIKAGH